MKTLSPLPAQGPRPRRKLGRFSAPENGKTREFSVLGGRAPGPPVVHSGAGRGGGFVTHVFAAMLMAKL
jgi:hypothetical protein